jgi:hypothetical protein
MRGEGLVYRLFRSGVLEGDDEVAVMHAPRDEGYAALTEALVTTRVHARRARRAGALTSSDENLIVRSARELPFSARRLSRVLSVACSHGLSRDTADRFTAWVSVSPDIKQQDAESLLIKLSRGMTSRSRTAPVTRTAYLDTWVRNATGEAVSSRFVSDSATAALCRLFAEDYPELHYREILVALGSGAGDLESRLRIAPIESLEQIALNAAARRGLVPPQPREVPPALASWLAPNERAGPIRQGIVRALVRSYRVRPARTPIGRLIRILRQSPSWPFAQRLVNVLSKATHSLPLPEDYEIRDWLQQRWPAEATDLALADRGFASVRDLRNQGGAFLAMAVQDAIPALRLWPSPRGRHASPSDGDFLLQAGSQVDH